MRSAQEIVLASTNLHKLHEFKTLFQNYPGFEIVPANRFLRNADKIGMAEKYTTYIENSTAKARLVNQGCHYPALADDSGLEVMELEGRPGVFSARYSKLAGSPSMIDQTKANMTKVLEEMKGKTNRSARFVCTLALVIEGIVIEAFGEVTGTLLEKPRGELGFGYDPIFVPTGYEKSFGEMLDAEKNAISHRAKAVKILMQKIQSHGIVLAKP